MKLNGLDDTIIPNSIKAPTDINAWHNVINGKSTESPAFHAGFYHGGIIRLRTFPDSSIGEAVGLMDFGHYTSAVWAGEDGPLTAESGGARLTWDRSTGTLRIQAECWSAALLCEAPASRVTFSLGENESIFGFGFQRTALDCRGRQLSWRRAYRSHSATVPFFFTSGGYGVFSNNSRPHEFDCGAADSDRLVMDAGGGPLDFFIIPGPSPRKILDGYTRLTGRPELPPKWALGLHYIARYFETQEGLLKIADRFRLEGIPCDILGVEPGWEKHPYSMNWEWCPERFPDPSKMISKLAAKGFRFELWDSGDAPMSEYLDPEVRREWYAERLAASLDIGVDCFKQDDPYPRMIKSIEMNDAEFKTALGGSGGYSADEVGELSNVLYSQTSHAEFERLTGGKRALTIFHSYVSGPGAHRWPVAWAGDFPNGPGMLNAGLSGHSMVAIDMKAEGAAGIHFGYLTPYSLIDSWAFYQEPWLLPPHLAQMHRFYGRLRSRLRPYLYTALWQSAMEGVPLMRAMALDYPHDKRLRNLTTQHLLGDWLLVGQAGSADGASDDERFVQHDEPGRLILPPGQWWDYWSGLPVDASQGEFEYHAQAPAGGPLLVKAGAIIPMTTCDPHETESASKLLRLDIFPDTLESRTAIYDDDGKAHPLDRSAWTASHVICRHSEDGILVSVTQFSGGDYRGPDRAWLLSLHLTRCPESVSRGDVPLPALNSKGNLFEGGGPGMFWDEGTGICWVRIQGGWRLRVVEDPEETSYDSFEWPGGADAFSQGGFEVAVKLGNRLACRKGPVSGIEPLPDRLEVLANPPERVALEGGSWLPMKTTIWATLFRGNRVAMIPGVVVRLVARKNGVILREDSAITDSNGAAAFAGWDYEPGVTEFEAASPGLESVKVKPRKAPSIVGRLR